jgi:lactate permease
MFYSSTMLWTPAIAPLGSLGLSALAAAIPLAVLFGLLAWGRLPGWAPAACAAAAAFLVAVTGWGMPAERGLSAGLLGAATGLFPICWIVVPLAGSRLRAIRGDPEITGIHHG